VSEGVGVLPQLLILVRRVDYISKRLVCRRPWVDGTRSYIGAAEGWVLGVHLGVWEGGSCLILLYWLAVLLLFGLIL
jgi:hypothetical protein